MRTRLFILAVVLAPGLSAQTAPKHRITHEDVWLVVFPDENHWILKGENSRFFYGEVHPWLARYLGAARTVDAARQ